MKTPEEIKKGLGCCNTIDCDACPYHGEPDCSYLPCQDALDYIKLLEDGIEQWELVAASPGAVEDMARENAQMEAEIDRQREKIRVLELSLQAVNDGNAALQRENLMLEGRLPRWISVKERLPDKMKHVFVFKQRNDHAIWPVAMWHIETDWRGEDGWSNNTDNGYFDVTHWMPLPEPPKEDDNERG